MDSVHHKRGGAANPHALARQPGGGGRRVVRLPPRAAGGADVPTCSSKAGLEPGGTAPDMRGTRRTHPKIDLPQNLDT